MKKIFLCKHTPMLLISFKFISNYHLTYFFSLLTLKIFVIALVLLLNYSYKSTPFLVLKKLKKKTRKRSNERKIIWTNIFLYQNMFPAQQQGVYLARKTLLEDTDLNNFLFRPFLGIFTLLFFRKLSMWSGVR